ncbi:MAG: hypothetical protein KJ646_05730 [Nanoarchaeota archaeon]|nr:hypothetical protein [Nanoarchaeota archaeon]MBU4116319.1 hypothetical protein [Nanoarchaeota archaeon]
MVNLKWCLKQIKGIRLIEPNDELSKEYIQKAREDFRSIKNNELSWKAIISYYCCYNALYSVMMKCGIKCEIHDCSIKLLPLLGFDKVHFKFIEFLKKNRVDVQYYLKKPIEINFKEVLSFLEFCEQRLINLNDIEINKIRDEIKKSK